MTVNVIRLSPVVRELRRIREVLERLAEDYERVNGLMKPEQVEPLTDEDVWYGDEEMEAAKEAAVKAGKIPKEEEE